MRKLAAAASSMKGGGGIHLVLHHDAFLRQAAQAAPEIGHAHDTRADRRLHIRPDRDHRADDLLAGCERLLLWRGGIFAGAHEIIGQAEARRGDLDPHFPWRQVRQLRLADPHHIPRPSHSVSLPCLEHSLPLRRPAASRRAGLTGTIAPSPLRVTRKLRKSGIASVFGRRFEQSKPLTGSAILVDNPPA